MIDTLIYYQFTDPVYFPEREPICPKCNSENIAIVDKGKKGFCRDCKHKDNLDNF